jgi:hypothetical protein
MPSGNDSAAAHAVYDYMFSQHLQNIDVPKTDLDLTNAFWIALFAATLILFFWAYARYFSSVHRPEGELYGASVFGGGILERIGSLGLFNWAISIATILYTAFFVVEHILGGQVYLP